MRKRSVLALARFQDLDRHFCHHRRVRGDRILYRTACGAGRARAGDSQYPRCRRGRGRGDLGGDTSRYGIGGGVAHDARQCGVDIAAYGVFDRRLAHIYRCARRQGRAGRRGRSVCAFRACYRRRRRRQDSPARGTAGIRAGSAERAHADERTRADLFRTDRRARIRGGGTSRVCRTRGAARIRAARCGIRRARSADYRKSP